MFQFALPVAIALTAIVAGWLNCFSGGRPTRAGWSVIVVVVVLTTLSTINARNQQLESERQLTAFGESNLELLAGNAGLADAIEALKGQLVDAVNVIEFAANQGRVELSNDDRVGYRASLEAIQGVLEERDAELTSSLLTLAPEEALDALVQEPEAVVSAIVSDSQECRGLLQITSSDESGRRMLATLVEGELAFVASVTGDAAANLGLMAASGDWDLSRGFELRFGDGVLQVDAERCGRPTTGMCRVSVDLRDVDSWQSDFLTTLASSELQWVTALSDPQRRVSLEPSTASRIRQAFQCIGAN